MQSPGEHTSLHSASRRATLFALLPPLLPTIVRSASVCLTRFRRSEVRIVKPLTEVLPSWKLPSLGHRRSTEWWKEPPARLAVSAVAILDPCLSSSSCVRFGPVRRLTAFRGTLAFGSFLRNPFLRRAIAFTLRLGLTASSPTRTFQYRTRVLPPPRS